jgi:hypothetical protein
MSLGSTKAAIKLEAIIKVLVDFRASLFTPNISKLIILYYL